MSHIILGCITFVMGILVGIIAVCLVQINEDKED